jgi:transposase-like protein
VVTLVVSCPHCQGAELVRNGKTPDGHQRFLCRDCQCRSTADPRPQGYSEEQRELILRAYQERSSLRGLTRTFGVSRNTVTSWLKKKPLRSPLYHSQCELR